MKDKVLVGVAHDDLISNPGLFTSSVHFTLPFNLWYEPTQPHRDYNPNAVLILHVVWFKCENIQIKEVVNIVKLTVQYVLTDANDFLIHCVQ